jgi:hypothetical protein
MVLFIIAAKDGLGKIFGGYFGRPLEQGVIKNER